MHDSVAHMEALCIRNLSTSVPLVDELWLSNKRTQSGDLSVCRSCCKSPYIQAYLIAPGTILPKGHDSRHAGDLRGVLRAMTWWFEVYTAQPQWRWEVATHRRMQTLMAVTHLNIHCSYTHTPPEDCR